MKPSYITRIIIAGVLFGIIDFHLQNTISPFFQYLFGDNPNPFIALPALFFYMLFPWYLLSLFVYVLLHKAELKRLVEILKNTVLAYLVAVLSYYSYYVFLLFFVGLPNFSSMKFNFAIENLNYAVSKLFLPGIIEWGIGAIILGGIIAVFNFVCIPWLLRRFKKG